MNDDLVFRCEDDPEANGRHLVPGDQRFTLTFPLEDGRSLKVHMGKEGFNTFTSFVAQMMIDDDNDLAAKGTDTEVGK